MKRYFILIVCAVLLSALLGRETVTGVTEDVVNTARNIRDILGVGRDVGNISK